MRSLLLLKIKHLETGYRKRQVIFDVSMEIGEGEIVAVIGPNGAGKSTILKAVSGLLPVWKGDVVFDGSCITGSSAAKNVRRGMTFCPQGNRVFGELTVRENLEISGLYMTGKKLGLRIEDVLGSFPALRSRMRQNAGTLSGGERQMLALARALIPKPRLLMLDEPSLGLAPGLLDDVFERISQIRREDRVSILIVEQKVRKVLGLSDRVYAMKLGRSEYGGSSQDLATDHEQLRGIFL